MLVIKDSNGIAHIERTPYNQTQEAIAKYDEKFGVGKWQYARTICSYLSEECGYGLPMNPYTCRRCDGECMRPLLKAERR